MMGIPVDGSWTLTFDDEFNGTTLNTDNWSANWLGAPGATTKPINSAELAAYNPDQVSVYDGYLHLKSVEAPVTVNGVQYDYQSGIVQSHGKFEQAYGYFEAKLIIPEAEGQIANWPAFWLNGETWPTDGEADIMEGLGGSAAYHYHSDSGGPGSSVEGDYTGEHIFGAYWEPGAISFYYDNEFVGKITTGVSDSAQYLILNNGIGGWGGPLLAESDLKVDWVHVYSLDPSAVAVTPEAGYTGPGDSGIGLVALGDDSTGTTDESSADGSGVPAGEETSDASGDAGGGPAGEEVADASAGGTGGDTVDPAETSDSEVIAQGDGGPVSADESTGEVTTEASTDGSGVAGEDVTSDASGNGGGTPVDHIEQSEAAPASNLYASIFDVPTDASPSASATRGDDLILGTAGDDDCFGGNGADLLVGLAGNDRMVGGRGNDRIDGGEGDDNISGGRGDDIIAGGDGNDTISGGRNQDVLFGGASNDILNGGAGRDVLCGGGGEDTIRGGRGTDTLVLEGDVSDFQFSRAGREVTVDNGTEVDRLSSIEQVYFTDSAEAYALSRDGSLSPLGSAQALDELLTDGMIAELAGILPEAGDGDLVDLQLLAAAVDRPVEEADPGIEMSSDVLDAFIASFDHSFSDYHHHYFG